VAFFALSTTSYPFMQLLNVLLFSIAGFLSLAFLLRTLDRLTVAQEMAEFLAKPAPEPPVPATEPTEPPQAHGPAILTPHVSALSTLGALDRAHAGPSGAKVTAAFRIWVLVFGLVGAQMSWVLRPFIGNPDADFAFLRPRTSNFFEAVFHAITKLLS
jgi:hypothetical protein